MVMSATAQEHIEQLAERSLRTYEGDQWEAAVAGFLRGLDDRRDTAVLRTRYPNLRRELWEAAAAGPEEFYRKMLTLCLDFETS